MRRAVIVMIGLSAVACSPQSGDQPEPKKEVPAVEQIEAALCTWWSRCSAGSALTCEEWQEGAGEAGAFDSLAALLDSIEAKRVVVREEGLGGCLTALTSLPCDGGPPRPGLMPACAVVLEGRVSQGGGCVVQEACGPGLGCVSAGRCDGTCTVQEDGCTKTADCAPGESCTAGECVPVVPPGNENEPCGSFRRCAKGLVCRDFIKGPPTCAKPPVEGDACSLSSGGECPPGLVCVPSSDFSTATCRPEREKGDACSHPFECAGVSGRLVCVDGACSERPSSGECLVAGGARLCDERVSFCDWTSTPPVCRAYRADGEPCSNHSECGEPGARRSLCLEDAGSVSRCTAQPEPERCTP